MSLEMHPNQLTISFDTVQSLVSAQFPQWSGLVIAEILSEGTVNALFRIGDEPVARFPLQRPDYEDVRRLLEAEAHNAAELLGRTRFPTPEPVAIGEPGGGYPVAWSIQTWVPGTVASPNDPHASIPFAHDLAEFITGVRSIPVGDRRFRGRGRGGDLRTHDEWMARCFEASRTLIVILPFRICGMTCDSCRARLKML